MLRQKLYYKMQSTLLISSRAPRTFSGCNLKAHSENFFNLIRIGRSSPLSQASRRSGEAPQRPASAFQSAVGRPIRLSPFRVTRSLTPIQPVRGLLEAQIDIPNLIRVKHGFNAGSRVKIQPPTAPVQATGSHFSERWPDRPGDT